MIFNIMACLDYEYLGDFELGLLSYKLSAI